MIHSNKLNITCTLCTLRSENVRFTRIILMHKYKGETLGALRLILCGFISRVLGVRQNVLYASLTNDRRESTSTIKLGGQHAYDRNQARTNSNQGRV